MAILTELRDPRVKNVTVIGVEVAPDMREAKVLVSIMGSESQQTTALRGLKNSAGFLQSKIAERIDTRYTPKLTFVADEGVKKSLAVAQILDQLALEKQKNAQAARERGESVPDDDSQVAESDDDLEMIDSDDESDDVDGDDVSEEQDSDETIADASQADEHKELS